MERSRPPYLLVGLEGAPAYLRDSLAPAVIHIAVGAGYVYFEEEPGPERQPSESPPTSPSCRSCCVRPKRAYSITLSARAINVAGTIMPSALAVLRLITSSNLVRP
jgi:hypothetical protein